MSETVTVARSWLRAPRLRTFQERERHATWLELFFDLCFVVAVAALAADLRGDPTTTGLLRFAGLFVVVWWGWMGFTWYATAFDNDDVLFRVSLIAAMLTVAGLAANVHRVAEGSSTGFVLAFVLLQSLLIGLWVRAHRHASDARAFCARYAAGYLLGAAVWLLSLLVPAPGRYWVWAGAVLIEMASPVYAVRALAVRAFDGSHIPERYGLFTLIVLGESIVAVAAGTGEAGWKPGSTLTAVMCFAIAACVWWTYFNHAETALLARGRVTAFVWGYGHLLVFASIAAAGAGTELAIESEVAGHAMAGVTRGILCGGVAVYFLAVSAIHLFEQRSLRDDVLIVRLAAAAIATVLGVAGGQVRPPILAALLLVPVLALTVYESVRSGPPAAEG